MKKIKIFLLSEKTYSFLISAFLISLPLLYAYSTTLLIVLLTVSLFSSFYHKIEFKKEYLIPFSFYLLIVISLFWTIDFSKSLRGLERELSFLLVPIIFILMPSISRKVLLQSLYAFAVSMAILAIFFIVNAVFLFTVEGTIEVFFYHNLVAPMGLNAIYISTMTSLSLLYLIFYSKKKLFNGLIILTLSAFLILLSSKNLIFITIISIIIGLLVSKKINLKRLAFIIILILGIFTILFYSPLKKRMDKEFTSNVKEVITSEKFNRVYPWTGSTIRLFQARIFYELLKENDIFFTGFGINASQEKIIQKQNQYNLYWGYNNYNFHNQYIQAFAELGFFGLILILLFLSVIFKGYLSSRELMSLFFFLVMMSVFMTESYLWRQRGLLHFLIIFSMLIKIRQPSILTNGKK
ncbi:MAG: O-antigen ligase family protein [Bacteroidetes bacterium]|nr:O-antigen ligase family protein [Bacteroidota bacterium]